MRGFLAFVTVAALVACAPQAESGAAGASLPEGAIRTGTEVYMVPLEQPDADGCQGYRQYSPTRKVTMAIYYRDKEGGFTANKLQADCYAKD